MESLRHITSGPPELVKTFNRMVDLVNAFQRMTGDGFVQVQKAGQNVSLKLDIDRVNGVMPKFSRSTISGASSMVRRAVCTENAGGDNTITANLYDISGNVLDGSGEEITIYCNISGSDASGGPALNEATPRLELNDDIIVALLPYNLGDSASTVENRWYCVTNFMTTEDCTCGE